MTRDEAMEKIRKCLRLAASSNAHEAAAALRQAQALMKEHGIGRDDVELAEVEATRRGAGRARVPPRWLASLMDTVGRSFGVRPIYHSVSGGACEVEFIGVEPRAELAGYAWDVLHRQLVRDRAAHVRELRRFNRANKTRRGDLFAEAWVNAVRGMVDEFALDSRDEELAERWIKRAGYDIEPAGLRVHKPRPGDIDSMLDGRDAGENARLRHGMGAGSRDALARREGS